MIILLNTQIAIYYLTKNQNSILNCIKNFIEDVGEPIEKGSDNDKEFSNQSVFSHSTKKNIKTDNARPNNPRPQGAPNLFILLKEKNWLVNFLRILIILI